MVIPREVVIDPVETTRRPRKLTKAYLIGVLHDATSAKRTYRIATKDLEFAEFLQKGIRELGPSAWIYREGKNRKLYIVEFSKSLLANKSIKSQSEKIEYIRGYFDAEGGIAKSPKVRYYIYFAQKNEADLYQLRNYLEELEIRCGIIHNPSKLVDPNYFRFFVKVKSYLDFAKKIGSNHPIKSQYLRVKI